MQEHPLIRLLDRESVTDVVGRPSLHVAEPEYDFHGWRKRVDDGSEPLPELLGQESLLRRRVRVRRRLRPVAETGCVRDGEGLLRALGPCVTALAYCARSGPIDENPEDPRLER